MAKIIWEYPKLGYTREQAEQKVKSLKFIDDKSRGWYRMLKSKGRRIHIVPSSDYFSIHVDSKNHHVINGYDKLCRAFIYKLNKLTLKEKINLIIININLYVNKLTKTFKIYNK